MTEENPSSQKLEFSEFLCKSFEAIWHQSRVQHDSMKELFEAMEKKLNKKIDSMDNHMNILYQMMMNNELSQTQIFEKVMMQVFL
jgi:hypothetical protein